MQHHQQPVSKCTTLSAALQRAVLTPLSLLCRVLLLQVPLLGRHDATEACLNGVPSTRPIIEGTRSWPMLVQHGIVLKRYLLSTSDQWLDQCCCCCERVTGCM
jgi:hypothetical protein